MDMGTNHKNNDVDSKLQIGAEINGKNVHCCEHDMNGNISRVNQMIFGDLLHRKKHQRAKRGQRNYHSVE